MTCHPFLFVITFYLHDLLSRSLHLQTQRVVHYRDGRVVERKTQDHLVGHVGSEVGRWEGKLVVVLLADDPASNGTRARLVVSGALLAGPMLISCTHGMIQVSRRLPLIST